MIVNPQSWQRLPKHKIAAIEFSLIDRMYLLLNIARQYPREQTIFFQNHGYDNLQKVEFEENNSGFKGVSLSNTSYKIDRDNPISNFAEIESSAVLVCEGFGKISECLSFQLRNFFFAPSGNKNQQLILIDEAIEIPLELYSMIPKLDFGIPDLDTINLFLQDSQFVHDDSFLAQACFGLPLGEIEVLLNNYQSSSNSIYKEIVDYKTQKLARKGLRVVPAPDVSDVGGLDLLERDLEKIAALFSPQAKERGLRPPKGCCLWGLPGTGKSLVSKMMSRKLNATLIACEWNDLLDVDLARSLAKLEYVLDVVDRVGNCVLFFDEFEKAFHGWNSGGNGGVLTKMAGKLLTWMQDHESPSIMLATINHLDLLPPELIRRFGYIWFFPSELHNGAMWEVFKLHLQKHFSGFHELFSDSQWRNLFTSYRGCSPAEIAGAVERTHHELFFTKRHVNLEPQMLLSELDNERKKFKPAITNKTTSNALAKILMEADFARPVRGKDRSKFASSPRRLFEKDPSKNIEQKINFDEYSELFDQITLSEPDRKYSYPF